MAIGYHIFDDDDAGSLALWISTLPPSSFILSWLCPYNECYDVFIVVQSKAEWVTNTSEM